MQTVNESMEWCRFNWYGANRPELPRVLLVGDDIALEQAAALEKELADVAAVGVYATSRLMGENVTIREMDLALAHFPPDLVVVGSGLQRLNTPEESYRQAVTQCLENLIQRLTVPILWCNATPITEENYPSRLHGQLNPLVLQRNAIAAQVAADNGIQVVDLYSPMMDRPEIRQADGRHYDQRGYQCQAQILAAVIRQRLAGIHPEVQINGISTTWPGRLSRWNGFIRHDFTINGIPAVVVEPNCQRAEGNPWYWRVHFFGAFPYADLPLLRQGWTVAHINVHELYGGREMMRRAEELYEVMQQLGYNPKPVVVGYSRGGLDAYSWASCNPTKTACIYVDNPVCDIKSWPGGRGKAKRCEAEWQNCLRELELTEETVDEYRGNPIDDEVLVPIARAGIPVLHVVAEEDSVVIPAENTNVLLPRFAALGGQITIISKPGFDHHPHCLEEPAPIVEFVKSAFYSRQ